MAATFDGQTGRVFWRGRGTFEVRADLHAKNRCKVAERVALLSGAREGVLLLKGGEGHLLRHSTDHEELFRQESFFHYLFGVEESDCFGTVDVATGKSVLYVPRLPEEWAVWMGDIASPDVYKAKYGVDQVLYMEELERELGGLGQARVHVIEGTNTDSGTQISPPEVKGVDASRLDSRVLHRALCECRSIKTKEEVELMRYVSRVSSQAHVAVMQACRPGMREYELESTFLHHCYGSGGCRHSSYTSIVGAGANSAVLHYGHSGAPNACVLPPGGIVLCDMGAEYHGYAADITCTFPCSGQFTPEQASVYNAVLAAHTAVIAALRPGIDWVKMHHLAERVILSGLERGGWVCGSVDDMMRANLGAIFMPHGLGHLLGIDTHDVGGYGYGLPERPTQDGANRLRMARVLEEGMVVTVEPGCYFNKYLVAKALRDPELGTFLNGDKITAHLEMGGVRIEDNVLITHDGAESFTDVPRTVEDVEYVMKGGTWPREI